jgi:phosphoenolpyruvate carboxykinase (ATP)
MKLAYTRAMITAALNDQLEEVEYQNHPVFGISMPLTCPGVPSELLNPRNTWEDKGAYDAKANHLARLFNENFADYSSGVNDEVKAAAPKEQASA